MSEAKRKIRFIINPISGLGKQKKIETLISEHIDSNLFNYEIYYTEAKAHAIDLSREAAQQNYDAVVAVGGDGTINEVSQGLIHSQTALGIIPAGSGNGLAHYLKIPLHTKSALDVINRFKLRTIDTGTINDRLFVSIAGVGFDAHVAEQFSKSKHRGFWNYARISFLQYIKYNPKRYKIFINGKVIKRSAFMLSFANSDQFGSNARIAPPAIIDDGLIDLCIVRKPRIYYAIFVVPFFFMGIIHKTPFVKIIKAKEFKVIQRKNKVSHIDGDEINLGRCLEIKTIPHSLKVIS